LEQIGYIEKVGSKRTLAGFTSTIYQINLRTCLALLFDRTNPAGIIEKMDETTVLKLLASLILMWDGA
jgi:hypothetical protein